MVPGLFLGLVVGGLAAGAVGVAVYLLLSKMNSLGETENRESSLQNVDMSWVRQQRAREPRSK